VAVGVAARSGAISSTNTAKRREWVFVIVVDLNEFIVDVLYLDWFDPATAGLKEGKKTPREGVLLPYPGFRSVLMMVQFTL
jgi:hypothetical protein